MATGASRGGADAGGAAAAPATTAPSTTAPATTARLAALRTLGRNRTLAQDPPDLDLGRCGLPNRSACLVMVDHPKMSALRSRTPTSAGMKGVVTGRNNKPRAHVIMEEKARDPLVRKSMWHVLTHYFAVDEAVATEVNQYLASHFVDIVEDNLRGQCTRGHSCKMSTKEELQRLLDLAGEG